MPRRPAAPTLLAPASPGSLAASWPRNAKSLFFSFASTAGPAVKAGTQISALAVARARCCAAQAALHSRPSFFHPPPVAMASFGGSLKNLKRSVRGLFGKAAESKPKPKPEAPPQALELQIMGHSRNASQASQELQDK